MFENVCGAVLILISTVVAPFGPQSTNVKNEHAFDKRAKQRRVMTYY